MIRCFSLLVACIACQLFLASGQGVPTLPPGYTPLPPCESFTQDNEGVISLLHYHTMTNCTWTVEASNHHRIRLDLRYSLRLTEMDSIVIFDGPSIASNVLHRFYQLSTDEKDFQHEVMETTGSYLTLQLSALGPLGSGDGEGFVGVYSAIPECPLPVSGLTSPGQIRPPSLLTNDFRLVYSKNAECAWNIVAPLGMRVRLTVDTFDLEQSSLCRNDYLLFTSHRPSATVPWKYYDFHSSAVGQNGMLSELQRYCGNSSDIVNSSFVSSSNTLGVVFHSDYLVQKSGFVLDYEFVTGCQEGRFQCQSDGQCLPPGRHCDGKRDCADGSDEQFCYCNATTQFTCAGNASECVPRNEVCQPNSTSLCGDGSDRVGCLEEDPCMGVNIPLFYLNRTVVAVATPTWMKTCLSSIPLGPGEKLFTLEILKNSLVDMYSYRDLALNSSKAANPYHRVHDSFDFEQYNISVDLAGELTAMEARPYAGMFSFHTDVMVLFNRLKDAHTVYQAPFWPLRLYLPAWFATRLVARGTRQVAVLTGVNGRLARIHDEMFGPLPGGFFRLDGQEITTINNKPAMQYLLEWAEDWPDYKSVSVRLNSLMASRSLDLSHHPLPLSDTINLTLASNETLSLHYLVTYPLPGPQDVGEQVLPNMRKQFDHRADYTGYYGVYSDILNVARARSGAGGTTRGRRSLTELHRPGKVDREGGRSAPSRSQKGGLYDRQSRRGGDRYRGTARADHETTHSSFLSSTSGDTRAFAITNTIVLKMKSFSDPEALSKLQYASTYASQHRIKQLVFDLTGNSGGYVKQNYEMARFLVQDWNTVTELCDGFDFKSATFWNLLSGALGTAITSIPSNVNYEEGMFLAKRIVNISSYVGYAYQTPLVDVEALLGNASLSKAVTGEVRSKFLKELLSQLLSPDSSFHKIHPDILISDVTNANKYGVPFVPKRAYYDSPRNRSRGGVTDHYTQKFYMTECKDVVSIPLPPSSFKEIFIITDGRCASACSQFVTKMQLSHKAKVLTFGGFLGMPIDGSSVAGGKVENWTDFWGQYSTDYELASLTSSQRTGGEAYFVNFSFPLPLTSRALPTFNFLEYYAGRLGRHALPREWYLIPPDIRLLDWPGDLHTYPTVYGSNPDIGWLGASYHQQTVDALDMLYRRALAMFSGDYPASNVLTPPPPMFPCSFVGPCQNSSAFISVRTSVAFIGVDLVAATLSVYAEHSCDDMRLVLHVIAICEGRDNGSDSAGGGTKDSRQLIVNPKVYLVTPWSDRWTAILQESCPCVTWVTLQQQRLDAATCPASRCQMSFIRYGTLRGYWLIQGFRNLFTSNVARTGPIPKLQTELRYTINAEPRNCPALVFLKPYFPLAFEDFTEAPPPVSKSTTAAIRTSLTELYPQAAALPCLYVFSDPAGKFDDGSGTSLYRTDLQCVWAVQVQSGYNIKLAISHELEGNSSAAHLNVFSGIHVPVLVKSFYQDPLLFTEFNIQGSSATFEFATSAYAVGASGFSVQYRAVKQCGAQLIGTSGTLASPTVNDTGLYSNEVACSWTITVPNGYRIQLQFQEFDLDLSHGDCEHDSVALIDPAYSANNRKLCGPFIPPPWSSVGAMAKVEFASDYIEQHRGFIANWTAVPSPGGSYRPNPQKCEVLTDQGGVVRVRWSEQSDLRHYDCNHTIRAPAGSRVRIYFTSFLLNCRGVIKTPGCPDTQTINLTVTSGNDPRSTVVLSGDVLPAPYISTASTVNLRFRAAALTLFNPFKYRGSYYSFQYTVCKACGAGQSDYGPCSGLFPTLCGAISLTPVNPPAPTTAATDVDPTSSSRFKLSHDAIAAIVASIVTVLFVIALVFVLHKTRGRSRSRSYSTGSLSASLSQSIPWLGQKKTANKQALLKDSD